MAETGPITANPGQGSGQEPDAERELQQGHQHEQRQPQQQQHGSEGASPPSRLRRCLSTLHPARKGKVRTCVWAFLSLIFVAIGLGFLYQLGCVIWEGSIESCRNRFVPVNVVEPVAAGVILLLLVGFIKWTFRECINDLWKD